MNTVYLIDKFMKTVFLLPAFVYIDNFLLFKKRRHRIFFIFHYFHIRYPPFFCIPGKSEDDFRYIRKQISGTR